MSFGESASVSYRSTRSLTEASRIRNTVTSDEREFLDGAVALCKARQYKCKMTNKNYPNLVSEDAGGAKKMTFLSSIVSIFDVASMGGSRMKPYLLNEVEVVFRKGNLSSCQKVCFAGCVTTHMLKYDDELFDNYKATGKRDTFMMFLSLERKLREHKGVCSDQGRLANSLINNMGLDSQIMRLLFKKGGHLITKVRLGNRNYLYDSTAGDCSFYNAD